MHYFLYGGREKIRLILASTNPYISTTPSAYVMAKCMLCMLYFPLHNKDAAVKFTAEIIAVNEV